MQQILLTSYKKTKVEENTALVSMEVASLYTNIPQEEGITTVCNVRTKHCIKIALRFLLALSEKYFN